MPFPFLPETEVHTSTVIAISAVTLVNTYTIVGPILVDPTLRHDATYSTFSTNTRMVPPQESPTFQAVSSATPNSSIFGLPLSMTSSASVTTAPSTQPPDTEPRKFPCSSITRLEPTGR